MAKLGFELMTTLDLQSDMLLIVLWSPAQRSTSNEHHSIHFREGIRKISTLLLQY